MLNAASFTAFLAALSLAPAGLKPEPISVAAPPSVANNLIQSTKTDLPSTLLPECAVTPYLPALIPPPSMPPYDRKRANLYRYRQQQSVNLGSWYVDL